MSKDTLPAPASGAAQDGAAPPLQPQPTTLLQALQAFKEAQARRVAHWQEYEEAMKAFFKDADLAAGGSSSGGSGSSNTRGPVNGSRNNDAADEPSNTTAAEAAHAHSHSHSHYDPPPRSIDDGVMTQILRLVTSGLLECSHEVRAIQIELGGPTSSSSSTAAAADAAGTTAETGASSTQFNRPDLAKLVGSVQDLENALLRKIVQRDQARRLASLASPSAEADADGNGSKEAEVRQAQRDIAGIKEEINEKMQEVNAEIAELL